MVIFKFMYFGLIFPTSGCLLMVRLEIRDASAPMIDESQVPMLVVSKVDTTFALSLVLGRCVQSFLLTRLSDT